MAFSASLLGRAFRHFSSTLLIGRLTTNSLAAHSIWDGDVCSNSSAPRFEVSVTPNDNNGIHPGDKRDVADVGDQCLRLVVKPFLIPEKQEDDHHRNPNEMVIKVLLKDAELN